jgi:hypothetical protein
MSDKVLYTSAKWTGSKPATQRQRVYISILYVIMSVQTGSEIRHGDVSSLFL